MNLLENFNDNNFSNYPYNHIVINNCLEECKYFSLYNDYPLDKIKNTNNISAGLRGTLYRLPFEYSDIQNGPWKELYDSVTTNKFFYDILEVLKCPYEYYYDDFKISLEFAIHKELDERVKFKHVDDSIFTLVYYFRDTEDKDIGGNHLLYDREKIVNEIKYESNKLIITSNFNNNSFHGISDKIDITHFRKTIVIWATQND